MLIKPSKDVYIQFERQYNAWYECKLHDKYTYDNFRFVFVLVGHKYVARAYTFVMRTAYVLPFHL